MSSSRKVLLILLTVTALSAGVVSPAAAAVQPTAPALSCSDGACQIVGAASGPLALLQLGANLALAQAPFETTPDGGAQATLDLEKDLTLSLPVGELTLTNARLEAEIGADGQLARLHGSADMPFPTFGLLDAQAVTPARADVGLDLGRNLPDIGVALQPDRPYLFFSANSFLSQAARAADDADGHALTFTPGQRLTLVVDTVDPVAWLDGQVTLSLTDQIALLGGLLETTPVGPYVPDTLPLRERTQYGISGAFHKDVARSRLTLRGGYLLDAGFLPDQLGIDAELVSVLGELTFSQDGVLASGALASAIEPDKVFDGSVRVETFVPFNQAAGPGYAGINADVDVPAARLGVGAGARAGSGAYELSGRLTTPFSDSDVKGKLAGKLPDVAGAVKPVVQRAGSAISAAAGSVAAAVSSAAADLNGYAATGRALAANALK